MPVTSVEKGKGEKGNAPARSTMTLRAPQTPSAPPPKRPSHSLLLFAGVLAIVVVIAAGFWVLSGGRSVNESAHSAPVERAPITGALHEIGTLEALNETPVLSPINGEIVWKIDDGTFVNAGDPIVRFDSTQFEDDLVTAEQ